MADEPQLAVGELYAGRFHIVRELGKGGSALVYEAIDTELDETVALKILREGLSDQASVTRFRREVRLARRVTHRNAARTYDLGTHEGTRFLSMEYVQGGSLDSLLERDGHLDVAAAARIAMDVCSGLAAAHEAGVVHRDIKPANILLEHTGRVVLTDFGIARATEGHAVTLQTQGMIGTPAYMAPEQVSGSLITSAVDIYAVGLVLYEMLTGVLPFHGPTFIATAMARLEGYPPDPRDYAEIPDRLTELVLECMARSPDDRPAVDEVREQLAAWAGEPVVFETVDLPSPGGPSASASHSATHPQVAVIIPGEKILAVLPFRYRGPSDADYLGAALAEELIDVLAMTRGLGVLGHSATAKYADSRDPRVVSRNLRVDLIVDGTLQKVGDLLRIVVRLIQDDGFQVWTARFDGELKDVFDLGDQIGKRIAESLRIKLNTIAHRGECPIEAIELFLRARSESHLFNYSGKHGTIALLEQALELAPEFKPALAAHAIACVRAWFMPKAESDRDWEVHAQRAVSEALRKAPELAEAHMASALQQAQFGEYKGAVQALAKALSIAPTYAEAHEYLGRLQCDAGRPKEGLRHLEVAASLNPTIHVALKEQARYHALHGDLDTYERILAEIRERSRGNPPNLVMLEMRVAAWNRNDDKVRECVGQLSEKESAARGMVGTLGAILLGELERDQITAAVDRITSSTSNRRYLSATLQVVAEAAALRDMPDLALSYIRRAADGVLIDINWIDSCPALETLHALPEFDQVRRAVYKRAEAIWSW